MGKAGNEIADLEWVYLFLDGKNPVAGEYFPFIKQKEEERRIYLFSAKKEADAAIDNRKEQMELDEGDPVRIAKVGRKEELAILLEYSLHGGEKVIVDVGSKGEEYESIALLNDIYEKLGYEKLFTEKNKGFPKIMRQLYLGECSFFTLPKAATTGGQIIENQFLTIHQEDSVLFFADLESAEAYYEANDLPAEWNIESDFKQFVQLLLYGYDHGLGSVILYKQNEKIEIKLEQAFWLIQKIGRSEMYLLLKEE